MNFESWIVSRMEENKDLFTSIEWEKICENINICKKVYIIAMKNVLFLKE